MEKTTQLDTLFAAAARGDASAAEEAFILLWPVVLKYCARRLAPWPGTDPPEDIAQAALEKLFSQLQLYDPQRPVLGWALALAHWECRTETSRTRRNQKRLASTNLGETSPPSEASPTRQDSPSERALSSGELPADEAIAAKEHLEGLSQLLDELSVDERALLGVGKAEAPMLAALSAATVRKRRSRLLAALRRAFFDLIPPAGTQ